MNILTRNFASTRPVQIATWTYKRYNLIVIFASTRPVQIATRAFFSSSMASFFASTRPVQIATNPRRNHARQQIPLPPHAPCRLQPRWRTYFTLPTGFASTRPVQIATGKRDVIRRALELCLHTPRADCNAGEA